MTWGRVYETIGALCLRLGRFDAAAAAFDTALAYNPYHPLGDTLQLQIARAYYDHGDPARAALTLEAMCATADAEGDAILDYRVFSLLGDSYAAQGLYPRAIEAYTHALALIPGSGPEYAALRQAYEAALGRVRQATSMDKPVAAR